MKETVKSESERHIRKNARAAETVGKREAKLHQSRWLDAVTSTRATGIERSGDPVLLKKSAAFRDKGLPQKTLQVPNRHIHMELAVDAMKVAGVVNNRPDTARRTVAKGGS